MFLLLNIFYVYFILYDFYFHFVWNLTKQILNYFFFSFLSILLPILSNCAYFLVFHYLKYLSVGIDFGIIFRLFSLSFCYLVKDKIDFEATRSTISI